MGPVNGTITALTGPCDCCGAPSSVFIQSRFAPGDAVLCAFPEYEGHLSSPPKSYKNLSSEGILYQCVRDAFCEGTDCILQTVYDWSDVDDVIYNDDCELFGQNYITRSSSGLSECELLIPGNDFNTPFAMDQQPFGPFTLPLATGLDATSTSTTYRIDGDGVVRGPYDAVSIGYILQTLSNEYTEDDAIARILPLLVYGGWSSAPSPDTYVSKWEIRTSGYSFEYTPAQFQIYEADLTPFTSYNYDVNFWRRPYGSGVFVNFSTATFTGTTNAMGEMFLVDDIPIDRGFETWAKGAIRV